MLILLLGMLQVLSPTPASVVHASSKAFEEFPLPRAGLQPLGVATDGEGTVWFSASASTSIFRYHPLGGSYDEFPFPSNSSRSEIWGIAVDAKGDVWFGDASTNSIWDLIPTSGSFKRYAIPTSNAYPFQLTFDLAGVLWFTELYGSKIARLLPSTGSILEFQTPSKSAGPSSFDFDGRGNVWFVEEYTKQLGFFNASSGELHEFPLKGLAIQPRGLAVDNIGRIWVADGGSSSLLVYDPGSSALKSYSTSSTSNSAYSSPYILKKDAAGRIWFNERTGNRIARLDPLSMSLVEVEFRFLYGEDLPTDYIPPPCCKPIGDSPYYPLEILSLTLENGGDVWFTEYLGNMIGHLRGDVAANVTLPDTSVAIEMGRNLSVSYPLALTSSSDVSLNVWVSFNAPPASGNLSWTPTWSNPILLPAGGLERVDLNLTASPAMEAGAYGLTVSVDLGSVKVSSLMTIEVTSPGGGAASGGLSPWAYLAAAGTILAMVAFYLRRRTSRPSDGLGTPSNPGQASGCKGRTTS